MYATFKCMNDRWKGKLLTNNWTSLLFVPSLSCHAHCFLASPSLGLCVHKCDCLPIFRPSTLDTII